MIVPNCSVEIIFNAVGERNVLWRYLALNINFSSLNKEECTLLLRDHKYKCLPSVVKYLLHTLASLLYNIAKFEFVLKEANGDVF